MKRVVLLLGLAALASTVEAATSVNQVLNNPFAQAATVPASGITGTVAIANGGTNGTSYTAPAAGVTPIVYFDGSKLTTDPVPGDLGYNPTTNTFSIVGMTYSGQVTSTVATGTAPLVVTSTTPVINLNIGGNAATATTAANLAGGSGGTIPYQSAAGTTAMLANGTAGQLLQSNGTTLAPSYTSTIAPTSINGVTTDSTTNKPVTAASLAGGTLPIGGTTVTINGGGATPALSAGTGILSSGSTTGAVIAGDGSVYDIYMTNKAYAPVMSVPTGTQNTNFNGTVTAPVLASYLASNSLQLNALLKNDNAGTGIAALAFASDTNYYKAAIGLQRTGVNGTGTLLFLNRSSSDAANVAATDIVMSITSAGAVSVPGSFGVTGSTTLSSLLLSTGAVANQLRTAQTTPPTCTTNCGTSPSVVGTDTAMVVTMGATGVPASGFVVTFNGTWAAEPSCIAQSDLSSMVVGKMPIAVQTTTTTVTITTNGTAPANSDKYNVICMGVQ